MDALWSRRLVLGALLATPPWLQAGDAETPYTLQRRALRFPADHGSHPDSRTEWWYMTGWLRDAQDRLLGFQITFFRSRVDGTQRLSSRLAARQLLFAHAAITDVTARRFVHEQTMTRWNGRPDDSTSAHERAFARQTDTHIRLPGWDLQRHDGGRYEVRLQQGTLDMLLQAQPSQALLLQGEAGWSRKGPEATQASFYYSQPQLAIEGRVSIEGQTRQVRGRAWLDHEWSEALLHPQAVGWDWIGINLHDGSALTAFRLRRADGSALWAGGSFRRAGSSASRTPDQVFGPSAVAFLPQRHWSSPTTGIRYPVEWQIQTPAGVFRVKPLLDAQELDSRPTTGAIYWEGLCELYRAGNDESVGLGYLEMTGYGERIRLG